MPNSQPLVDEKLLRHRAQGLDRLTIRKSSRYSSRSELYVDGDFELYVDGDFELQERHAEHLAHMTAFTVHGCSLRALPASLGTLVLLQQLDVSDNQLTALPGSIGRLSSLLALNVSNNRLSALPETISGLSSLQRLQVANNRLTELPETIGELSSLTYLAAQFNENLAGESWSRLPSLGTFGAYRTAIGRTVSPDVWQRVSTSLTRLTVDDGLTSAGVDAVTQISSLTDLVMSGTGLNTLPDLRGRLPRLKDLSLSKCSLGVLDETTCEWLCASEALTKVTLYDCGLVFLPQRVLQWLWTLKGHNLNLKGNKLAWPPQRLVDRRHELPSGPPMPVFMSVVLVGDDLEGDDLEGFLSGEEWTQTEQGDTRFCEWRPNDNVRVLVLYTSNHSVLSVLSHENAIHVIMGNADEWRRALHLRCEHPLVLESLTKLQRIVDAMGAAQLPAAADFVREASIVERCASLGMCASDARQMQADVSELSFMQLQHDNLRVDLGALSMQPFQSLMDTGWFRQGRPRLGDRDVELQWPSTWILRPKFDPCSYLLDGDPDIEVEPGRDMGESDHLGFVHLRKSTALPDGVSLDDGGGAWRVRVGGRTSLVTIEEQEGKLVVTGHGAGHRLPWCTDGVAMYTMWWLREAFKVSQFTFTWHCAVRACDMELSEDDRCCTHGDINRNLVNPHVEASAWNAARQRLQVLDVSELDCVKYATESGVHETAKALAAIQRRGAEPDDEALLLFVQAHDDPLLLLVPEIGAVQEAFEHAAVFVQKPLQAVLRRPQGAVAEDGGGGGGDRVFHFSGHASHMRSDDDCGLHLVPYRVPVDVLVGQLREARVCYVVLNACYTLALGHRLAQEGFTVVCWLFGASDEFCCDFSSACYAARAGGASWRKALSDGVRAVQPARVAIVDRRGASGAVDLPLYERVMAAVPRNANRVLVEHIEWLWHGGMFAVSGSGSGSGELDAPRSQNLRVQNDWEKFKASFGS